MDSQATTPFYLDKGLWVAVLTPLFILLNQKWGLTLDATTIAALVLPIAAYILGHKYKSGQVLVAEIGATASTAAANAPPSPAPSAAGDLAKAGVK